MDLTPQIIPFSVVEQDKRNSPIFWSKLIFEEKPEKEQVFKRGRRFHIAPPPSFFRYNDEEY